MTAPARRAAPEPMDEERLAWIEYYSSGDAHYTNAVTRDLVAEIRRLITLNHKLGEIGESTAAYADKLQKKLTAARRKAAK